jgi:hypothetical protein
MVLPVRVVRTVNAARMVSSASRELPEDLAVPRVVKAVQAEVQTVHRVERAAVVAMTPMVLRESMVLRQADWLAVQAAQAVREAVVLSVLDRQVVSAARVERVVPEPVDRS